MDRNALATDMAGLRQAIYPNGSISETMSANKESDLAHLAMCIHHGLTGFITRDSDILSAATRLKQSFGIDVVAPTEFLTPFEIPEIRRKTNVVGSLRQIEINDVSENERTELYNFFESVNFPKSEVTHFLAPGPISSPRRRLIMRIENEIIGVASFDQPPSVISNAEAFLAVDETFQESDLCIDHFLEVITQELMRRSVRLVSLWVRTVDTKSISTAASRGFRPRTSGPTPRYLSELVKLSFDPIVSPKNWSRFRAVLADFGGINIPSTMPDYESTRKNGLTIEKRDASSFSMNIFELETLLSPVLVLFYNRPGTIFPIHQLFAEELLGYAADQRKLLPDHEASLKVERAYYRRPKKQPFVAVNTPIVFYVSGKSGGSQAAIGCGRITSTSIEALDTIPIKYLRQGVLDEHELGQIADNKNRVQVITFDNFKPFERKISYRQLKQLGLVGKTNLVTAEELTLNRPGIAGGSNF